MNDREDFLFGLSQAPSLIVWHPNDTVVLVANSRADIQVINFEITKLDTVRLKNKLNSH